MQLNPPSACDLVYGFSEDHLGNLIAPQWVQNWQTISWAFDRAADGSCIPPKDPQNPQYSFTAQAYVPRNAPASMRTVTIPPQSTSQITIQLAFYEAIFVDRSSGKPVTYLFEGATGSGGDQVSYADQPLVISYGTSIDIQEEPNPPNVVVNELQNSLSANWASMVSVNSLNLKALGGSNPVSVTSPADFASGKAAASEALCAGMAAWMASLSAPLAFNPGCIAVFYFTMTKGGPGPSSTSLLPVGWSTALVPSGEINGNAIPPALCVGFDVYGNSGPVGAAITDSGTLFSVEPFGQNGQVVDMSNAPVFSISPKAVATFFVQALTQNKNVMNYLSTRLATNNWSGTKWYLQAGMIAVPQITALDPSANGGTLINYLSPPYSSNQTGFWSDVNFWDQIGLLCSWDQTPDGVAIKTSLYHLFEGSNTKDDDDFVQTNGVARGGFDYAYVLSAGGTTNTPELTATIPIVSTPTVPNLVNNGSEAYSVLETFFNAGQDVSGIIQGFAISQASNASAIMIFGIEGVAISNQTLDTQCRLNFQLTTNIQNPVAF